MPTISVHGMTCDHCKKSVTSAIENIMGTTSVSVDLLKKEASWKDADLAAPVAVNAVKSAVARIGFTVE